MILNDFLENPIGKGDASINVSAIRDALSIKYDVYSKNKKVEMKIFHQPIKDIYWIWLKMPSETVRTNSYDVVFTFTNPNPVNKLTLGIGKFDIQIFANTPSFAYTYAYVYNKNGLLIPSLEKKLGKTFINKSPEVRNRNEVMLYDKYVYFGARYILESKVLNRAVADAKAMKYSERSFTSKIRSLDTIMDEYRVAEDKVKHKNETKKGKETKKRNDTGDVKRVAGNTRNIQGIDKNASRKTSIKKTGSTIKKK